MIKEMLAVAAGFVLAGPAHAAGSTVLPEPGTLTLLSMGLAGVLIGRRFARKPPER
jgi:hypothetical protein